MDAEQDCGLIEKQRVDHQAPPSVGFSGVRGVLVKVVSKCGRRDVMEHHSSEGQYLCLAQLLNLPFVPLH